MGTRDTVHSDNPAGRLYGVFRRFRAQESGVSLDQAWAAALGFDINNSDQSSMYLAELASTVQHCVLYAKSLQHAANVGDLLAAHGEWARAVIGFGMSRTSAINPSEIVSQSAMALLGMLSGLLHTQAPDLLKWDREFEKEKLAEVHAELGDLADQLSLDPEVPEAAKAYIVQKLYGAIDSIMLVELRGAQRVAEDLAEVRMTLDLINKAPQNANEPWLVRTREAFESIEAITKSVLSMLAPVVAVTALIATGNVGLALLILAADPKGHPALETIGKIFPQKEIGSGSGGSSA